MCEIVLSVDKLMYMVCVKILIGNVLDVFCIGMIIEVLVCKMGGEIIFVFFEVIMFDDGKLIVWKFDCVGLKVVRILIEVVEGFGISYVVKFGLKSGDFVVVVGIYVFKDG